MTGGGYDPFNNNNQGYDQNQNFNPNYQQYPQSYQVQPGQINYQYSQQPLQQNYVPPNHTEHIYVSNNCCHQQPVYDNNVIVVNSNPSNNITKEDVDSCICLTQCLALICCCCCLLAKN